MAILLLFTSSTGTGKDSFHIACGNGTVNGHTRKHLLL